MRLPRLPQARRDVLGPAAVLTAAAAVVVAVWVLTGWWSLSEQTALAELRGFAHPRVLFWGTDAFAVAMALVALAAAIDNRSAPLARIGYGLALAGSAYFNAEAAAARLGSALTPDALAMAAGVPLASFCALEVILAAVRATVRRWRGLPAPAGAPAVRLGRVLLGGWPEWCRWRRAYLDATRPDVVPVQLAEQLRAELAAEREQLYAVTVAQRERLTRELDSRLAALPAPAPAADLAQLRALDCRLAELGARLEGRELGEREWRMSVESRLADRPTPALARAPRPVGATDGDTDTGRMRRHWETERAAGRTPTGAELDRHVGRDPKAGYGRQLRSRWLAEDESGVRRLPVSASAGE